MLARTPFRRQQRGSVDRGAEGGCFKLEGGRFGLETCFLELLGSLREGVLVLGSKLVLGVLGWKGVEVGES